MAVKFLIVLQLRETNSRIGIPGEIGTGKQRDQLLIQVVAAPQCNVHPLHISRV